jgi:hypothetical protein
MNSRDAAYDDEQLRRAIEASKEENVQDSIETIVTRRTKRGRSDSEESVFPANSRRRLQTDIDGQKHREHKKTTHRIPIPYTPGRAP